MEPIRSHDALFKFVFGEPEQMAELLRARLEPSLRDAIEWPTLAAAPASFVDAALGERRADLLFTVSLRETTALLHVVAEHKAVDDRFTAWQVAVYVMRILERWRTEHPAAPLPPVLPFVLYHGDRPWRAPRNVRELFALPRHAPDVAYQLAGSQLHLRYELFDLSLYTEDRLDELRIPVVTDLTLRFLQFLRHRSITAAIDRIRAGSRGCSASSCIRAARPCCVRSSRGALPGHPPP